MPTLPDGHAEATHAVGERAVITEPAAPVARARRSSPALLVAALAVLLLAGGGAAAWLALDSMSQARTEAATERAELAASSARPPPSPGLPAPEAGEGEPAIDPAPAPGEPPLEDEGAGHATQTSDLAPGLDPPPIDPAPPPSDEVAGPRAAPPAPRAPRGPALAPGTLQVSIAPAHAGPRYGWVRVGGERRPLPAVLRDVPAGPTWVHYQIGEAPERRARVRVEPGRTTIVQLPR
ncbi:MAG: hypothetical protein M5U28_15120 [Sandaracinaceae bacterium]|nr:hypothetical protein [Sandaracinaceae bacterium]